jgi:uncharacterized protein
VPWLLRDDEVLATLEVADGFGSRVKGLLGRDGIDGVLLLKPARSVHTLGMRFAIDVAYCDDQMRVLRTVTMRRHRIGRPCVKAHCVLEAEAGAFAHWELRPGDQLEIRE